MWREPRTADFLGAVDRPVLRLAEIMQFQVADVSCLVVQPTYIQVRCWLRPCRPPIIARDLAHAADPHPRRGQLRRARCAGRLAPGQHFAKRLLARMNPGTRDDKSKGENWVRFANLGTQRPRVTRDQSPFPPKAVAATDFAGALFPGSGDRHGRKRQPSGSSWSGGGLLSLELAYKASMRSRSRRRRLPQRASFAKRSPPPT